MTDDGNVVVKRIEITVDHVGKLSYDLSGLSWPEAIQLLELTKLYVFADHTGAREKG